MQINCRFPTHHYAPHGLLRNVSCHSALSLPKNGQLIKSHFYPRSRCSDAALPSKIGRPICSQSTSPKLSAAPSSTNKNEKKTTSDESLNCSLFKCLSKLCLLSAPPLGYCISTLTDRLSISLSLFRLHPPTPPRQQQKQQQQTNNDDSRQTARNSCCSPRRLR